MCGPGLLIDSVIMTDNLATIHDSEIDRVIAVSLPALTITPAWMSSPCHVAGNHCHDCLWEICAQSVRLDNQCGPPLRGSPV
jgi:hypothetical protein